MYNKIYNKYENIQFHLICRMKTSYYVKRLHAIDLGIKLLNILCKIYLLWIKRIKSDFDKNIITEVRLILNQFTVYDVRKRNLPFITKKNSTFFKSKLKVLIRLLNNTQDIKIFYSELDIIYFDFCIIMF